MMELYMAVGGLICGIALAVIIFPKFIKRGPSTLSIHASLERIREVGDLVALTAHVKEVVTKETDPGFLFTNEKMILICEFEVEYRYNLRKAQISKDNRTGNIQIELPQIRPTVQLKDFHTYDRTNGRLLGVIPVISSPKDEDNLRRSAIEKAAQDATTLGTDIRDKIEASATRTLQLLCSPLTNGAIEVSFLNAEIAQPKVESETGIAAQ